MIHQLFTILCNNHISCYKNKLSQSTSKVSSKEDPYTYAYEENGDYSRTNKKVVKKNTTSMEMVWRWRMGLCLLTNNLLLIYIQLFPFFFFPSPWTLNHTFFWFLLLKLYCFLFYCLLFPACLGAKNFWVLWGVLRFSWVSYEYFCNVFFLGVFFCLLLCHT